MKWKKSLLLILIILLLMVLAMFFAIKTIDIQELDMVAINELIHNSDDREILSHYDRDFVIIDSQDNILYDNWQEYTTIDDAIRNEANIFDLEDGKKLVIRNTAEERFDQALFRIILIFIITILTILVLIMLSYRYLYKNIIEPFQSMEDFASEVARGNLDYPLDMDKANVFGKFTLSFDILRTELKKSKEEEARLKEEKNELIAQLSHDLKSPIASIMALSQVLELKVEDDDNKAKAKNIYSKAKQISDQISELFSLSMEELDKLEVKAEEEESSILVNIIDDSDYKNKIREISIPEALIYLDKNRFRQVIDNILSNSYKYSDTDIELSANIFNEMLILEFKDFGPGVDEDELDLIFTKFYRGKKTKESSKEGAGLGLFTSKKLMEDMGGDLKAYNTDYGFVMRVEFSLI